jgi:hypothetical protein
MRCCSKKALYQEVDAECSGTDGVCLVLAEMEAVPVHHETHPAPRGGTPLFLEGNLQSKNPLYQEGWMRSVAEPGCVTVSPASYILGFG